MRSNEARAEEASGKSDAAAIPGLGRENEETAWDVVRN